MRDNATRVVPPVIPNRPQSSTRAAADSRGGWVPSSTDATTERADSGRRPSAASIPCGEVLRSCIA